MAGYSGGAPDVDCSALPGLDLSYREAQVWRLLGLGYRIPAIATYLDINPSWAKNLCKNVVRKLGVHSTHEAAVLYLRDHPHALRDIAILTD